MSTRRIPRMLAISRLGTKGSVLGEFFRDTSVEYIATVKKVKRDAKGVPVEVQLDAVLVSTVERGLGFTILDGCLANGAFTRLLDKYSKTVFIYSDSNTDVVAGLRNGIELRVDNLWDLTIHGFHRHQVPTRDGFYGYDYLRDENGKPLYPQRDVLIAPTIARSVAGGSDHSGNITGKVVVMDNLKDYDSFPWHADWCTIEVQKSLGGRFGTTTESFSTRSCPLNGISIDRGTL